MTETLLSEVGSYSGREGEKDVVFSPNGMLVATGGYHGQIDLLEAASGALRTQQSHGDVINSLTFSPDGNYLNAAGCGEDAGLSHLNIMTLAVQRYDIYACTIVSIPTKSSLLTGIPNIRIIDPDTGNIRDITEEGLGTFNLSVSPDGQLIAAEIDNQLRFWDLETGMELTLIPYQKYQSNIEALAWSSNNVLALASSNGLLTLWRMGDHQLITSTAVGTRIKKIVFSPDGTRFVTLQANSTSLWTDSEVSR